MDELIRSELDRIHDEDERQNARLKKIEDNQSEIHALAMTVEKLATNMSFMVDEQKKQNDRLEKLEQVPVDNYEYLKRQIISILVSAIIGGVLGFVLKGAF